MKSYDHDAFGVEKNIGPNDNSQYLEPIKNVQKGRSINWLTGDEKWRRELELKLL